MGLLRLSLGVSLLALGAAACSATVDPVGGGPSSSSTGTMDGVGGFPTSTSSSQGQGGSGDGGFAQSSTVTGIQTAAGGAGPTSIALFESEVPPPGGEGGASSVTVGAVTSSGAGGSPSEGEDLLVVISDNAVACGDPYSRPCVGASQTLFVWLPPDKQEVGVYPLVELQGTYTEWFGEGEECNAGAGTGGSFVEGSLSIVSADNASLAIDLVGSPLPALDGPHDVARCNPITPASASALAYVPRELPDGSSVSTGQTGDTRFYIHFADHLISCADPLAPPGPNDTFRNFLVLMDPELLVAGATYSFGDPRIVIIGNEAGPDSAQSTSGTPQNGSITINEVTSSFVDVTVTETGISWVDGGGQIARCGG